MFISKITKIKLFSARSLSNVAMNHATSIQAANKTKKFYADSSIIESSSLGTDFIEKLKSIALLSGKTTVSEAGFNHAIKLDDRLIMTPLDNVFAVPNTLLGSTIAFEWASQGDFIKVTSLPLTNLAVSAIDMFSDPGLKREKIDKMIDYLMFDQIRVRCPTPPSLAKLQDKYLDLYVDFMQKEFNCNLNTTYLIDGADLVRDDAGLARVRAYLESLDPWKLAVVDLVGGTCRSITMGIAMVKGFKTASHMVKACRTEEDFQISQWGLIKGAHDLDVAYVKSKLHGAQSFNDLL